MELFRPSSSRRTSNDVISGTLPKINLQGESMMGKADFKHQNLHGQIGFRENVASCYFGMNPELPRISSFLCRKYSEFLQLNSDAMIHLTRVEKQAEQSTIIGPPIPFVAVPSPLSGNHLSTMSRGYCLGGKIPNNQGIGFSLIYKPGGFNTNYTLPLRMEAHARESYDINALSKATRQSCQVYFDSAEQTHALHGNATTPIRRNKANEFIEIVRDHEACFLSFYHPTPIPFHVMNMLHWCFGSDMEREMPLPKSYPTQGYGTPRFAHQNVTLGFRRSYVDFPHRDDLKRLDNKELNALLFQRKFSGSSKGNYRLLHIQRHVFQCSIDQCGICFIQQKVQTATPEEKFMIIDEIMPHAIELVTDVYGNYVIQKMIEQGAPFQWRKITICFLGSVLSISCQISEDMYGHVVELSVHPYGCHVVQHGKVVTMSKQKYSSNVIEKCLVFSSYDERQKIINEVLTTADLIKSGELKLLWYVLLNDQYANYVVQKMIETCDEL
uniref:PUM-HD domain-containing protein n=1 Tax=Oryza punctata TaxID=4537 RepID=A0A0E0L149_ORYPU